MKSQKSPAELRTNIFALNNPFQDEDILLVLLIYFISHNGTEIFARDLFQVWPVYLKYLKEEGLDTNNFHPDPRSLQVAIGKITQKGFLKNSGKNRTDGYLYISIHEDRRVTILRSGPQEEIVKINSIAPKMVLLYKKQSRKRDDD